MLTLATHPVAPLLDRLFAEADGANAATRASLGDMSRAEIGRILHSKTEYPSFYARLKDAPMAVSRETGTFLYMLARALGARSIVEFGTSFGLSTLHLAAALRDNGGGRLITTEFERSKAVCALSNLTCAGLADLVDLREGDAVQSLASDLPETIDLLFLDGAKALYPDVLDLVEPWLRPGAAVIADNASFYLPYLTRVRAVTSGYLSLPFGKDMELSIRLH
jgi:predicted O-methyltransferase YrrM